MHLLSNCCMDGSSRSKLLVNGGDVVHFLQFLQMGFHRDQRVHIKHVTGIRRQAKLLVNGGARCLCASMFTRVADAPGTEGPTHPTPSLAPLENKNVQKQCENNRSVFKKNA